MAYRDYADDGYEDLPAINPTVLASDQVVDAVQHLHRHPDTLVRWPYHDLDGLTGPMGEGEVWFACAFSGGGKTTFVASTIDAWRTMGKKVYVMPLELQPHRFRTYLACMTVGVHPGEALSGNLATLPNGEAQRAALKQALYDQVKSPYVDRVMVSPQRSINLRGLQEGVKEAMAFGADVMIVDHIDHIKGGPGTNLYAESCLVNDAALQIAQDNGMLMLFTSQLNMEIVKGDKLSKYQPPQTHHVMFPTAKIKNATGIIGLFRPTRSRRPEESGDAYIEALKAARRGDVEPHEALEPNTMGVTAMKLRNYGHHEGKRIALAVNHGRVTNMDERDRYSTAPWGGPKP